MDDNELIKGYILAILDADNGEPLTLIQIKHCLYFIALNDERLKSAIERETDGKLERILKECD